MKFTRKHFLSTLVTGFVGAAMSPVRLLGEAAKPEYSSQLFTPYIGTTFHLMVPERGGIVDVVLQNLVQKKGMPETNQFSLEFVSPMGELVVERTYVVRHDQLGELSIFLTPIKRDEQGHGLHRADFNILQRGYGPSQNARRPRTVPFRTPT